MIRGNVVQRYIALLPKVKIEPRHQPLRVVTLHPRAFSWYSPPPPPPPPPPPAGGGGYNYPPQPPTRGSFQSQPPPSHFIQRGPPPPRFLRSMPTFVWANGEVKLILRYHSPLFFRHQDERLYVGKRGFIFLDLVKDSTQASEEVSSSSESKDDSKCRLRVSLSTEEMGLIVTNAQHKEIRIERKGESPKEEDGTKGAATGNNEAVKVLKIEPLDGGGIRIGIDFEQNGVGGASPADDRTYRFEGPISIELSEGQVYTFKKVLDESISYSLGWSKMLEISNDFRVNTATPARSLQQEEQYKH